MINSIFSRLAPKETKFFPLFRQLSAIVHQASQALLASVEHNGATERAECQRLIKALEREGDVLTHGILDELSTTFITPFDREDMHELASRIDDVLDRISSCAKRIVIYNPRSIADSGCQLCEIIVMATGLMVAAMDELERFKQNPAALLRYCTELHDLENTSDDIYENFMTKLFEQETDCIELIKTKEVMQELEHTTDSAEQVGKVLKSLIVKYA